MGVNQNISDLFFNRDFSGCKEVDSKGQFAGFNEEKMREEAKTFLDALNNLSVVDIPSDDELLADFYGRV